MNIFGGMKNIFLGCLKFLIYFFFWGGGGAGGERKMRGRSLRMKNKSEYPLGSPCSVMSTKGPI